MLFGFRAKREKQVAAMLRKLGVLTLLKTPMPEAFGVAAEECKDRGLRKVLKSVARKLSDGNSLENALAEQKNILGPLLHRILTSEKDEGKKSTAMVSVAREIERVQHMWGEVLISITVPLYTIICAWIVFGVFCIWVIPVFAQMYGGAGKNLPELTVLLIDIAEFIKDNLAEEVAAFSLFIIVWTFSKTFRHMLLNIIPLFSRVQKRVSNYFFMRYLSAFLSVDIPISDAIVFAADQMGNNPRGGKIKYLCTHVDSLAKASQRLGEVKLFPKSTLMALAAYEESPKALYEAADAMEAEIESVGHAELELLKLIVTIVIGVFIGLTVIGMYLPIFSMSGAITG